MLLTLLDNPANDKRNRTLTQQSMENFLSSVERRAYAIAVTSLSDREDALDIVQEAMTQLVVSYAHKPCDEWRPLFYRILQSKINDLHRKRKFHRQFKGWLPHFRDKQGNKTEEDPIETIAGPDSTTPHTRHVRERQISVLKEALIHLPPRQQQVFMLRCWEGLNTKETAIAMKCTEGSVKTHYSRALIKLRDTLGDYWYD
jgi:RNA polymerase sigma-70 factor (ECF subfamily)